MNPDPKKKVRWYEVWIETKHFKRSENVPEHLKKPRRSIMGKYKSIEKAEIAIVNRSQRLSPARAKQTSFSIKEKY